MCAKLMLNLGTVCQTGTAAFSYPGLALLGYDKLNKGVVADRFLGVWEYERILPESHFSTSVSCKHGRVYFYEVAKSVFSVSKRAM